MKLLHHPTEVTLSAFAGATLDEGNSLVVATHLALCGDCREIVKSYELVGGTLVDEINACEVSRAARASVLDRVAGTQQVGAGTTIRPRRSEHDVMKPLALYAPGSWRWIGLGVQWKPVHVNSDAGTRVFMLKAAPGTRLPDHRHVGTEWTCVLQGAFTHQLGRYGPGDFDEADDSVEHSPSVDRGGDCICLVALNGRIELKSWLGRLIQPLVAI
ncbi:MAG: hypothetical protein RLZ98_2905 [Pseudomonadota bacterium]|jgi:putative transcriptional regulator